MDFLHPRKLAIAKQLAKLDFAKEISMLRTKEAPGNLENLSFPKLQHSDQNSELHGAL